MSPLYFSLAAHSSACMCVCVGTSRRHYGRLILLLAGLTCSWMNVPRSRPRCQYQIMGLPRWKLVQKSARRRNPHCGPDFLSASCPPQSPIVRTPRGGFERNLFVLLSSSPPPLINHTWSIGRVRESAVEAWAETPEAPLTELLTCVLLNLSLHQQHDVQDNGDLLMHSAALCV